MAEYYRSPDQQPRDMRAALDHYWTTCYYEKDSPSNLQTAFEELIQTQLELTPKEAEGLSLALARSNILPSPELFEASPNEAREYFALAPLRFLGDYVEMMYSLHEIIEWYERAIDIALGSSVQHTNETCLVLNERISKFQCQQSTLCPRKAVLLFLIHPIRKHNFDDAAYILDPELHTNIVEMKVHLAATYKLISKLEATLLINAHRQKYTEHRYRPL